MHLKQLKLAGFKSFVDPTVISFPSQLVAVVGPNGCGKSNVIDAVRWVMGESSAKNLRGESMVDVIFNGSSNRKAVGLASVELVFDNSMGRLTGQYASYQEIAVKRTVTRDGEASYFLNGSRCRRRDITDIFLGTGAGARGYSIIGQGTISRLVEARPEELRAFIEEAAGVSKYRERRRETLSRIHHTRDNLVRVADIRDELGNQLQRLLCQAEAARHYHLLKDEERACRADILALKWQALHREQTAVAQELATLLLRYEQQQALIADRYKQQVSVREAIHVANEALQTLQTRLYQLATDVAVIEKTMQQHQQEKERLLGDEQQLQQDGQALSNQLQQDKLALQESRANLEQITSQLQSMRLDTADKQQAVQRERQQLIQWQARWDEVQSALTLAIRETHAEKITHEHLIQRRQETLIRLEKVQDALRQAKDELSAPSPNHPGLLSSLQATFQGDEARYQALRATSADYRQQFTDTETELQAVNDAFQRLKSEQAALTAIIGAALGREAAETDREQASHRRLIDVMKVEVEWQPALEWILGARLKAVLVDSMDSFWSEPLQQPCVTEVTTPSLNQIPNDTYPRLANKIQGVTPSVLPPLETIWAASTMAEALSWLPFIKNDESIITPQGCWIGKGWLQRMNEPTDKMSLLASQQQLTTLNERCSRAEEQLAALRQQRDQLHAMVKSTENELAQALHALTECRDRIRLCETELACQRQRTEQWQLTQAQLIDEQDELIERLQEMGIELAASDEALARASTRCSQFEVQKNQLILEKSACEALQSTQEQLLEEARLVLHQLELQNEREQLLIKQACTTITRDQARLETITERREAINLQRLAMITPDATLMGDLNEKRRQHHELENTLTEHREQLNRLITEQERGETEIKAEEKRAKGTSDRIVQQQLLSQTLVIQTSNLAEALEELNTQAQTLLTAMSAGITITAREQLLLEIGEKILQLGAINLAAIDEYEQASQRKQYLDSQYQDLTDALNLLDAAIVQMDNETKQRLQQTFDEVNTAFKALFPRLFGGGRAMLELTCDNLLEAGILVMAQPPGKRNSTIHLLSGGEKAMTAVALVFAIFQLNPSPFCMLDEVDAPLDDVNVGRFCALVKEMSQFVQFLFITHNKVTMELADHLIGVTMREPGVSRVVAVDVEQALVMTESSD